MSRFQTSWEIAKRSWAVLRSDKSLAWFPVLSALASIAVMAAAVGVIAVAGIDDASNSLAPIGWVVIVVGYLGLAFVQTYFLAGLVAGADMRLHGQDSTVGKALAVANSRLHRLLPWAVVSATVSIVISAIEQQGLIGRIIANLIGLAWNLITFMTVPILVLEDVGVGAGLKRSKDLFKKTWGENVIAFGGLSIVGFLLMIPGIALIALGAAAGTAGLIALGLVGAVWLIATAVIMSALSGIYRTALYRYASTGQVPGDFAGIDFQAQFRPRRNGGRTGIPGF
ncbi:MAG: DUF6159 family protein [Acidimicrobiia bacterium]